MEKFPEFILTHPYLFSLLFVILTLLIWNVFGDIVGGVKLLTTDEVTQLINRENAEVIDIRSQNEFENGHIINAKNISLQELPEKLNKLKKINNKGIIFYCSNGSLSLKETQKLVRQGEEMIYCLRGGIASWKNANLPLTKGLKNV
ncbi:MAG: rhodanese-like domain-containing protein [Pseudomonadota bacterium]|nr:rhodanese-like domain-containing protein [Pseudomonadota bacterium]